MRKKLVLVIAGVIVLLLILVTIIVLQNKSANKPTPTGIYPDNNSTYINSYSQIQKQDQPYFDQRQEVAQLILKLPYKGTNFSLDFSYKTNSFTLTLKKGFETQGNQEFTQFLQNNGINDIKLLDNLVTKTE